MIAAGILLLPAVFINPFLKFIIKLRLDFTRKILHNASDAMKGSGGSAWLVAKSLRRCGINSGWNHR